MAGQSEAADDLIAELAKLMAQDAQVDRTAKPSGASAAPVQFAPVRIPGDPAPTPAVGPAADFIRSFSTPVATKPAQPSESTSPAAPAPAPEPVTSADPFQFDFGIQAASGPASALDNAPTRAAAQPTPVPSAPPPPDHDSIADLISAEMATHPEPQLVAPAPEAAAAVPPAPAAAAPVLMSTVVASSAAPQSGVGLGSSRPDHDRFKVPPVFGLGSAQPPVAPVVSTPVEPAFTARQPSSPAAEAPKPAADTAVALDPIDEIENLIGRAMRVEFASPGNVPSVAEPEAEPVAEPVPRPAPSPALRSLATPVLPHREVDSPSVADETIFAAAKASGAKLDWVNAPSGSDPEPQPLRAAPRQRRAMGISRALAGPLVAITLLLAAGLGLYWVLGLGGREAGPPPLLTADAAPIKEVAPPVSTDDGAATQSVVFNEMDGVTAGADEQLVSRDQTDVNEVTQVAATGNGVGDEGLANRKVRTVKVRPDGTIVSGDDSVAGSAILPVDRPNVPAVPGAVSTSPELLANTDPITPADPVAPADTVQPTPSSASIEPTPVTTPAGPAVVPVEPGSTVPAVDLAGTAIAGKSATIPLMRPSGLRLASAAPVASAAPLAAAEPVTTPVAEPAPSAAIPGATEVAALGDTAPAYVQLASQRSEAEARQSAQNMVTRYGPLFGGANLEVQRVDLGTRGIYYRVRVPATSLEQANVICTNVKAAGGDCFTM